MKQLIYLPLLTLLLFSCIGTNEKKYVIGVSQCSEDIWREKLNNELIMSTYQHDNITLRFASANDNDQRQAEQINRFIQDGVDLLIVSPNQVHTISPVIDKAYSKGIPVILFDRKTDSKNYTAFIGADNYEVGHEIGLFIAHQLEGKGTVAEISGLKASSPAIERNRGFYDAIKSSPGITFIDRRYGDWLRNRGETAMDSILTTSQNIDYVFAQNDRMALGALQSLQKQGLNHTKIVGVDALSVPGGGMENVRDGHLIASYIYPTRGDLVMQLAMNILEGKPYKRDNYLKGALVTQSNASALLVQNEEMNKQTARLNMLHGKIDTYLAQYNHQQMYLLLFSIISILLIIILVYVYRSIVTRRRMEAEATRAKLQFFTNISHELRTPLTLIADPVEQIINDKNLNQQQRGMLQLVRRNVNVLNKLVGEILDFRKVQNGKMKLNLSDFNLSEAIQDWTNLFITSARKKNITLALQLTPNIEIRADKDKIERICYNLLSNAMKYTPNGGKIILSAALEANKVILTVEDNGIGIATTDIKFVFDRFYQANNSIGGTGIGLALVKSLVDLHHGQISVESDQGKGSKFTIHLPIKQEGEVEQAVNNLETDKLEALSAEEVPNQARHQKDLIEPHDVEKPEVLVIDDNADIRAYLREALADYYKISEAADGESGVRLARRIVPDLIISDVMMPIMDGLKLCNEVKTDKAISHIPVILLSARNLDEQRAEGYEHGADAYITKPFSLRLLLARIDNLIQSRRQLASSFTHNDSSAEIEQLANETDKTFIKQLRKIIQENLSDSDLSVEKIGDEIGLSRVQLYRKVKALTGLSPVEMLRKARLAKARQLLRTTDKNVSQVAYAVGFSTPSYFSKCYKDEFGETPRSSD